MKPIKSLLVLFLVIAPSAAFAQGYYGPGYGGYRANSQFEGGFWNRTGRPIFGFSVGLGGMSDKGGDLDCPSCDYNPLAGEISAHLGGFVGPRLALMAEVQANMQTIAQTRDNVDSTLIQGALMFAAQYWLTPQLWIKGGIGFSSVQVQDSDAFYGDVLAETRPENGVAVMGAVGFELLSARRFSVDLQGRLINGSYKQLDNNITGFSVGIGINWF